MGIPIQILLLYTLVKVSDWNLCQTNRINFDSFRNLYSDSSETIRKKFSITFDGNHVKINLSQSKIFKPNQNSIRALQSEWIMTKFSIRMNLRSEWFKLNLQSESIRTIPTTHSLGLKNCSGFIRIQSFGLSRIDFKTDLHQKRLKTFFGLTLIS